MKESGLLQSVRLFLLMMCLCAPGAIFAGELVLVPDKVAPAIADRQGLEIPSNVHLSGWVGGRIEANEANRLVKLDPDRLLEGYRKRPGRQAWDGEHVGKWLHAATLAWVYTGDPALRQKLDFVVAELLKCQLEDGYLGTYVEKDRWTEWDVWAHKYNLIGLLTYIRFTGNTTPLPACRRMADLLCNTFGDEPGKRDIITAGEHVGLAPTSVLEPMVLLYRLTGEPRYLEFCKYILRAWEQPNGPKLISTLLTLKRVDKVGNGKAYEMLSCLNGLVEYYRTVGDPKALAACLNAWQDIVQHRLYITGAASYGELFHGDYDLPNVANVGETCVTVTWLQFNAQLLRLAGEARFAEQLEHVVLNQLFGAQKCDGSGWGYYVQMEGKKPYSSTLDGHCCLSSGPRGVALIPTFAITTDTDGVVMNLYDAGEANLELRDHTRVALKTTTQYPADSRVTVQVTPAGSKSLSVKLRVPAWCRNASVRVNGRSMPLTRNPAGYVSLTRTWSKGDRIEMRFPPEARVVAGDHKNQGKAAVLYGPLVLAADEALLPSAKGQGTAQSQVLALSTVALVGTDLKALKLTQEPAPAGLRTWSGEQVFRVSAVTRRATDTMKAGTPLQVRLAPFADAGQSGSQYKVWLPLPSTNTNPNLLLDGQESRSRRGNVSGSIIDDELMQGVVTFDNTLKEEDWFAVRLNEPVSVARVVFIQGQLFHDGGWFDSSPGKPRVQVKTRADGPWETVGELADYPPTTATSSAGLSEGQRFNCQLASPPKVCAVRVTGKPACGDNPGQAFSSCAELQAFEK